MPSNVASKDYITLNRGAKDKSSWQKHLSQICHYNKYCSSKMICNLEERVN